MNAHDFNLFEKYYNGEMTPEEKSGFEKSLAADPILNASFKEYVSIYDALKDKDSLDLRTKLKEIREEEEQRRKTTDFFGYGYNWLWMAALITIIISITVITSLLITWRPKADQVAFANLHIEAPKPSNLERELSRFAQRNSDFKILLPKEAVIQRDKAPITFSWTISLEDPLIFELIDWDGNIVFSSVGPVTSPYTISGHLPGGAMVFRFRTTTEAYSIGFLYLK
jgi:hypothetical protein